MLSDNAEKSRNPLKKAMRRRNAKTVQFAAPTYVEASDYDYSSDEDESHMIEPYAAASQTESSTHEEAEPEAEEGKAEPKDSHAEGRSSTSSQRASFDREQAATAAQALAEAGIIGDDTAKIAPKLVDKTGEIHSLDVSKNDILTPIPEAAPLKSPKRTRNTDSFLKDDSQETRKITLTPGLLRDESKAQSESSQKSSMESLTKSISPPEQPKKESKEKKKEVKKGGMLSGLFKSKKKDKKNKDDGTDAADAEKVSLDRESPRPSPMTSGKTSPVEKIPVSHQMIEAARSLQPTQPKEKTQVVPADSSNYFIAELEGSEAAYEMGPGVDDPPIQPRAGSRQGDAKASNPLSPITNPITSILKTGEGAEKPKKAKRSKKRVELDDFDSPENELTENPFESRSNSAAGERLSESPVEISSNAFMHGTDIIHIPQPGDADEESEEESDGPGSLTSSPSIIEHPAEPLEVEDHLTEDSDPTPTARSPQTSTTPVGGEVQSSATTTKRTNNAATSTPNRNLSTDSNITTSSNLLSPLSPSTPQSWNDDSLRAWLEDGSEVRDMLVLIHDKTGVTPAPPDHPLMSDLFVQQRRGVQDMMGQLDGLLGSYLQRKGVRL